MLSINCLLALVVISVQYRFSHGFHARHDIVFEFNSKTSSTARFTLLNLDPQEGRSLGSAISDLIFDPRRPTRIFIHGFYSNRETLESYTKAYREAGNFNFIVINWLKGAVTFSYGKARHRVKLVSMGWI